MSRDLLVFEQYIEGMLTALSAGQRRLFFSRLSRELARINATRMRANIAPDGTPFEPRKPQTRLRAKRGRVRAMFQKLPKSLKPSATDSGLEIAFGGRSAQIADVHHYGKDDAPNRLRPSWRVRYPARELLGISESDQTLIVDRIVEQVSNLKI